MTKDSRFNAWSNTSKSKSNFFVNFTTRQHNLPGKKGETKEIRTQDAKLPGVFKVKITSTAWIERRALPSTYIDFLHFFKKIDSVKFKEMWIQFFFSCRHPSFTYKKNYTFTFFYIYA